MLRSRDTEANSDPSGQKASCVTVSVCAPDSWPAGVQGPTCHSHIDAASALCSAPENERTRFPSCINNAGCLDLLERTRHMQDFRGLGAAGECKQHPTFKSWQALIEALSDTTEKPQCVLPGLCRRRQGGVLGDRGPAQRDHCHGRTICAPPATACCPLGALPAAGPSQHLLCVGGLEYMVASSALRLSPKHHACPSSLYVDAKHCDHAYRHLNTRPEQIWILRGEE